MDEANPGIELGIARHAFLEPRHANEDHAEAALIKECANLLQAVGTEPIGAVDFRRAPQPISAEKSQAQVYEYADPNHRLAGVASAYAERPSSTVVIAPDQAERRELNQLIRADLQAKGMVEPESTVLTVRIEQSLTNLKSVAQYRRVIGIDKREV